MIKCPKCSQSLTDWATHCQFCGADVKAVPRPVQAKKVRQRGFNTAPWIWPAYYACAGYYILSGLADVIQAVAISPHTKNPITHQESGEINYFGVVIGVATIIIGLGLIAKVEFIRGIVNFFAAFSILGSLFALFGLIVVGSLFGPIVIVFIVMQMISIFASAMIIYLIGETD